MSDNDTGKTMEIRDAIRKYKRIEKTKKLIGCLPFWLEVVLLIITVIEIIYLLSRFF